MKTSPCLLALVVFTCLGGAVAADDLRLGTKMTEDMFVAYAAGTSANPTARKDIEAALTALWPACQQNALHPIGVPILAVDLASVGTGMLNWEAWLPLADALEAASLPQITVVKVKQVAATPVAFTYHQGTPWSLENAFQTLAAWAVTQNLSATTRARAVVYVGPFGDEATNIITECQIELRQ